MQQCNKAAQIKKAQKILRYSAARALLHEISALHSQWSTLEQRRLSGEECQMRCQDDVRHAQQHRNVVIVNATVAKVPSNCVGSNLNVSSSKRITTITTIMTIMYHEW
jgi:hypothetical protein